MRRRGIVTLVFDDGYQEVFDLAPPLLRRYGIRAVFAVPIDTEELARAEEAPVAPLSAWKALCAAEGHELAAHGITHRPLTSLADADLDIELRWSRDATGATTLVYPGGAHDARVVRATRSLFRAARTVRRGFESVPPINPFRLSSFVATRKNFSVWKWNLRALWALLTNRWLIETYHDVALPSQGASARRDSNLHMVPLTSLEAHLKFLARLPILIATIRDIVHP